MAVLRHGAAKKRCCCSMFLDAIETWNKVKQWQIHQLWVDAEYCEHHKAIEDVIVTVRTMDGQQAYLRVWRDQGTFFSFDYINVRLCMEPSDLLSSTVAKVKPKWAESLDARTLTTGDTSSSESFAKLEAWLRTCSLEHNCVTARDRSAPERLIEIIGDSLFLRESIPDEPAYACLSHCWGAGGLVYKLMRSNKHEFCRGLERQHLPKTFQDAIEVCVRLKIRFVWIDALCKLHQHQYAQTAK